MAIAGKKIFHNFSKRLEPVFRIIGLLTVVSVLFIFIIAPFAARWLLVDDKPIKSDAIVSLAGNFTRSFYAADLYNQGFATKVFLSRPVRDQASQELDKLGIKLSSREEISLKVLTQKGVPKTNIIIFGSALVSTLEEAETLRATIKPLPKRLLIVTSPTHTRRAKIIFSNYFPETEIRVLATPYEAFPENWWRHRNVAISVVLEPIKLLYYYFGGGFRSTDKG